MIIIEIPTEDIQAAYYEALCGEMLIEPEDLRDESFRRRIALTDQQIARVASEIPRRVDVTMSVEEILMDAVHDALGPLEEFYKKPLKLVR